MARSELTQHVSHVARTGPLHLVNSSLEQFAATIKALTDAFPYYDRDTIDSEMDTCKAAADRLAALVKQIDPEALESDGFWETFYLDVANGDFATTDLLHATIQPFPPSPCSGMLAERSRTGVE